MTPPALLAVAVAVPSNAAECERLQETIERGDRESRAAAAHALAHAGRPGADPTMLIARLARPRRAGADRWDKALRAIGADIPDPNRQVAPFIPDERAPDWLGRLLDRTADDPTAHGEAIEVVALLRALSATRRHEVVEPIVRFAWGEGWPFRDECGRALRRMDPYGVPGLIRALVLPGRDTFRMRRYALYQLNRTDRAQPSKALAVRDHRLRAEILRAYGDTLHDEAVEAVIAETDSQSPRVREAARRALLRYLGAPAPPEVRRRLKLPGGDETEEEMPLYRTWRQRAEAAVALALLETAGAPADPGVAPVDQARALLRAQDRRRAADWRDDLLAAERALAQGRPAEAIERYRPVLARDPHGPHRARMVPAFLAQADALRARGDAAAARGALEEALLLGAAGDDERRARARIAAIDGAAARDPALARAELSRALRLDPTDGGARAALAALDERERARARARAGAVAGSVVALALVAVWLGRRLRGP